MTGARFDILFAGELIGDADPETVRSQLQQRFKLSEAAAQRLFSGRTVTVKRDVDTATASRYRKVFRDAKALIEIRPVDAAPEPPSVTASLPPSVGTLESALESRREPMDTSARERVGAAPSVPLADTESRGYEPVGPTHTDGRQEIDLSHLSLVPGNDWTLEDCQPQFPPVRLPDTSHLRIIAPDADADADADTKQED